MEMLSASLTLATVATKAFAVRFGNNLQTGILITVGALLLLVGTLWRHKFPSKQQENSSTYTLWPKPAQSTAYVNSAAGAAHGTSFSFMSSLERQTDGRPLGHLAIHSTPTTERRANLV